MLICAGKCFISAVNISGVKCDKVVGFLKSCHKCDLIYRNRSKSHIGSYEIIDFKDFNTL